MKRRIYKFYHQLSDALYDFYLAKLMKPLEKISSFLTNNFVIKISATHLILFRFIRIKITNKRREAVLGYMFISLWLIGYVIFTFYPVFYSLYLSFHRAFFNLNTGFVLSPIGFKNFQGVLSDARLLPLFANYVGKLLISVPLIIIFAIIIAVLINQPIKGKGIFRTIFFLPVVIATGPVIGELVSQQATTLPSLSNSSVVITILNSLPPIIATPIDLLFRSMLLILWYAGIPVLIFLAGLQKVDHAIYEAASVDGASPWDTFWKITLPSLKGLIKVNIIYIVVSMSLYVESGGILEQARTHMIHGGSDSLIHLGYGYAAAIAWVYFLIMVLIILLYVGLLSLKREKR